MALSDFAKKAIARYMNPLKNDQYMNPPKNDQYMDIVAQFESAQKDLLSEAMGVSKIYSDATLRAAGKKLRQAYAQKSNEARPYGHGAVYHSHKVAYYAPLPQFEAAHISEALKISEAGDEKLDAYTLERVRVHAAIALHKADASLDVEEFLIASGVEPDRALFLALEVRA
jgi:hypothetical protein